jgi:hypothetical protein
VLGNLANTPAAEGVEAGSLFLYAPSSPLSLAARRSAMVPFLDATARVRQIAWLDEPGAAARRAVLLENTTGQTLPPGTLAVFADGGFAGEAPLDRLKPSERRLISFGADLDVEIHQRARTEHTSAKIVEARDDTLIEHYVRKRVTRYEVVNKSGSGRAVVLELDAVSNARVTGANAVGFDEARRRPYAQFDAVARQRAERTLIVEEGLERRYSREKVTARLLRRVAATASERTLRERLLRAATALGTAEALREEVSRAGASLGRTLEDLASLRLSMQALYGKAGADEIARRIVQAEAEGSRLRARRAAFSARALAGERRAWEILKAKRFITPRERP